MPDTYSATSMPLQRGHDAAFNLLFHKAFHGDIRNVNATPASARRRNCNGGVTVTDAANRDGKKLENLPVALRRGLEQESHHGDTEVTKKHEEVPHERLVFEGVDTPAEIFRKS